MQTGSLRIFVDFDGTITTRDVGDSIFERFLHPELLEKGWHEEMIREWKAGRISSGDCLVRECDNTIVTRPELDSLLDEHTLTPGFIEMAEYCGRRNIPLVILSDGLDYYIKYILAKHGLGDLPHYANHMYFKESSIGVEFPHEHRGCGRCANCKRWHIESIRRDGEKTVFIGDGYSDRYAVMSVDKIFARRDLAEYCAANRMPYTPFRHFYDIMRHLENGNGEI